MAWPHLFDKRVLFEYCQSTVPIIRKYAVTIGSCKSNAITFISLRWSQPTKPFFPPVAKLSTRTVGGCAYFQRPFIALTSELFYSFFDWTGGVAGNIFARVKEAIFSFVHRRSSIIQVLSHLTPCNFRSIPASWPLASTHLFGPLSF